MRRLPRGKVMTYVLRATRCPCGCDVPAIFIIREGVPPPVAILTHEGTALARQICDAMNRAKAYQPRPALRLVRGGRRK